MAVFGLSFLFHNFPPCPSLASAPLFFRLEEDWFKSQARCLSLLDLLLYRLIGNLRDFPTIQPWITYTKWKRQYGMALYGQYLYVSKLIQLPGECRLQLCLRTARHYSHSTESRHMICSKKRSHIYSDRLFFQCVICKLRKPFKVISLPFIYCAVLVWEFLSGLMHYGDEVEERNRRNAPFKSNRPDCPASRSPTYPGGKRFIRAVTEPSRRSREFRASRTSSAVPSYSVIGLGVPFVYYPTCRSMTRLSITYGDLSTASESAAQTDDPVP